MNQRIFNHGIGWLIGAASVLVTAGAAPSSELATPFRVEASGKPIDVEIGHAAPLVADFDGDGKSDLLVGQFGDGKLRIYRNQSGNPSQKFGAFGWFQAGGADGKVPAG